MIKRAPVSLVFEWEKIVEGEGRNRTDVDTFLIVVFWDWIARGAATNR
jgi:hypothetical protein